MEKSGEAPAFPRNRADRGGAGEGEEVAGRTRKGGLAGGGGDVMRVRPGKPHYRRPGPGPQRPGGPEGASLCHLSGCAWFPYGDRGARAQRRLRRDPASSQRRAGRVLQPPEPGVDGAWGRQGARSARERPEHLRAPRTAGEGPRVSAALSLRGGSPHHTVGRIRTVAAFKSHTFKSPAMAGKAFVS